jgi:putative ABC transport system permease protein
MFFNYFKIAWRNLFRNRSSSIINIGGLTVGMSVALLIALWIGDEVSFNTYHKNYDRIARIMQTQGVNGRKITQDYVPFPIGRALRENFGGDLKYVVMTSYDKNNILSIPEKKLTVKGMYMDKDAPTMFSLHMLKGSAAGLSDAHSVLLAAATATAIFGDRDPVGENMLIDNRLAVKVTGVYEDLPQNSEFYSLGFIAPWDLYAGSENWITRARDEAQWDNFAFHCYVQLAPHADIRAIDRKIRDIVSNNYGVNARARTY